MKNERTVCAVCETNYNRTKNSYKIAIKIRHRISIRRFFTSSNAKYMRNDEVYIKHAADQNLHFIAALFGFVFAIYLIVKIETILISIEKHYYYNYFCTFLI